MVHPTYRGTNSKITFKSGYETNEMDVLFDTNMIVKKGEGFKEEKNTDVWGMDRGG